MASEEAEPKVAEEEEAAAPEEESTATFAPIVQLEEQETVSGEEEETPIYTQRSKLYVFGETLLNKGTGTNTWNERGVGDVRLMQHTATKHIRVLMRQEKTMKCIANHVVDPRIDIRRNGGSDRAWMWRAFDYSNGEELVETLFSLKFKDSDVADAFKAEFDKAMKHMEELLGSTLEGGEEAGEGTAAAGDDTAADEAAEALAKLSTNDKQESTQES